MCFGFELACASRVRSGPGGPKRSGRSAATLLGGFGGGLPSIRPQSSTMSALCRDLVAVAQKLSECACRRRASCHGSMAASGARVIFRLIGLGHRVYVRFSLACAKTQGLGRGIPGYVGTCAQRVQSFVGGIQPGLTPLATGDPAKVARASVRSSTDFGRFCQLSAVPDLWRTGEWASPTFSTTSHRICADTPWDRTSGPGYTRVLVIFASGFTRMSGAPGTGTRGGRVRPGPGSLVFHGVSGIWINRSDDT